MQLLDILSPDTIQIGLKARDKDAALSEVVDLLADQPAVVDLEAVRDAVVEREAEMSTGVGKGLGLPHAKSAGVTSSIAALAVDERGLEFDAIDGEPVKIVFLLVGPPEAKSLHMRILSRFSRLMNHDDIREGLLGARSAEEVLEQLSESESSILPN